MKMSNSDSGGENTPGEVGIIAAKEHALHAIKVLIEADPDGWPEHLAHAAGAACGLQCGSLDLLADAATQIAGMAHRLEAERRDEEEGPSVN